MVRRRPPAHFWRRPGRPRRSAPTWAADDPARLPAVAQSSGQGARPSPVGWAGPSSTVHCGAPT
eukprot:3972437-Alexandrium_andersonii.AAC.1